MLTSKQLIVSRHASLTISTTTKPKDCRSSFADCMQTQWMEMLHPCVASSTCKLPQHSCTAVQHTGKQVGYNAACDTCTNAFLHRTHQFVHIFGCSLCLHSSWLPFLASGSSFTAVQSDWVCVLLGRGCMTVSPLQLPCSWLAAPGGCKSCLPSRQQAATPKLAHIHHGF